MLSLFKTCHYLLILGSFLLLLKTGISQTDSVSQSPKQMESQEGQAITLHCSFAVLRGTTPYLFWYRQYSDGELQLILQAYKTTGPENYFSHGRFSSFLYLENNTVPLTVEDISLQDEAVYFCALRHSGGAQKVTFGSGTRLIVALNLEDSPPSIYELRPDASAGGEKKDKAACLITDYFPNPLKVKSKEGEKEVEVNGSVVVVKEEDAEKGTGSYGIVLWGDKDDNFHCAASDKNGQKFESNTADDPGTCLAESGDNGAFETDERLNLLSLTVLGLRVVFLKSVAFNLLLTFRLWSRGG